jgi:hypothetical protein
MSENIEKIVVKSKDELIDVVREISKTDAKKILVSFIEDSEILISSINLKVLLDSADEKDALLILQIPGNPTGVRNAKLADIPVIDTPGMPSQEIWESTKEEYRGRREKRENKNQEIPQEYKSENITSFEEKINSVLDKNRVEKESGKDLLKRKVKKEEKGSGGIVIDKDITEKEESSLDKKEDLTRVDFKDAPSSSKKKSHKKLTILPSIKNFLNKFKKKEKTKKVIEKREKGGTEKKSKKNVKAILLKIVPRLVIPLAVVALLFVFLYFYFAPYADVTLFIQSKPVEVEKVFVGSENINEIDFEELKIPVKRESITKSVSDTVNATGTAFRGDKATGSVTISYINPEGCSDADEPITLSEGVQISTSTDGKNYVLTGSVTVTCNNYSVVGVEAVEVGEEYNIASGKYFGVSGYDSTKVYGVNSSAFTGGSKEEYTVLSQQDVNDKVDELTKIATEEAEGALQEIGGGWEIIDSTIDSSVKEGSVESAVAIGTETNTSDISLEVEASATYYYTQGVDSGLNDLLTEAAVSQNLFESREGLDLNLKGDIQKDLSVSEEEGEVNVTLTASTSVEPSVDKEDILDTLSGMKWEEGVDYLNNLSFTSKPPVIKYSPENIPIRVRRFPSRQGKIKLVIDEDIVEGS